MNKTKIFISLISLLVIFSCNSFAQKTKDLRIGHINSADILKVMPGRDQAQKDLTDFAGTLEEQLKIMSKELETKYQDYLANETKMTELIKQTKQKELTQLQARIQEYQESAQDELQKKESELLEPLLKKAQDAIQKVAKEKGYTYILDTSSGSVLYFEDSDDISVFVKKELGIQ